MYPLLILLFSCGVLPDSIRPERHIEKVPTVLEVEIRSQNGPYNDSSLSCEILEVNTDIASDDLSLTYEWSTFETTKEITLDPEKIFPGTQIQTRFEQVKSTLKPDFGNASELSRCVSDVS